MNKKFLFVLSLLVMLSLVLSACGGGATSAPAADEKIELRVWGHQAPAFNAADQAMLDEFMKQNPNVTIKYETFPWDVFI